MEGQGCIGNRPENKEGSREELIKGHSKERGRQYSNSGVESCDLARFIWQQFSKENSGDLGCLVGSLEVPEEGNGECE